MPVPVRLLFLTLSVVLAALIYWAVRAGDFSAAGDFLTKRPWGIVSLFDLYFGFVIIAFIIAWTERKPLTCVFWITPLFVLGNVWTGLWLLLRGHKLYAALKPVLTGGAADRG